MASELLGTTWIASTGKFEPEPTALRALSYRPQRCPGAVVSLEGENMLELKRIYWSRQALRFAYSAVDCVVGRLRCVLSLMPRSRTHGGWTEYHLRCRGFARNVRRRAGSRRASRRFHGRGPDNRGRLSSTHPGHEKRRDPSAASRGSSAAKAWHGPAASARWRRDSAVVVPGPLSTATIFISGPKAGPPACRTLSRRAAGATGPKARGDPLPRPAGKAGTATADVRHARRF